MVIQPSPAAEIVEPHSLFSFAMMEGRSTTIWCGWWFFASLLPVGGVAVEAMGAGDKLGDGALAGIR